MSFTIVREDETIEERDKRINEIAYKFRREERNLLLQETDKYMMEDYPISSTYKEIIKQYRQQLRDVPKNNWVIPPKPDFI